MTSKLEKFIHEMAEIEFDGEVLQFRYHEGVYVDTSDAMDLVARASELVGSQAPVPTLIHVGRVKGVSKGARDFFSSSDENLALSAAAALIVSSPIARIVANFFMGINKPKHPTRMFTSEA
ncbi:MAG: hypothetical protein ACPG4T_13005, partial [Nannocystaceae bacterium]